MLGALNSDISPHSSGTMASFAGLRKTELLFARWGIGWWSCSLLASLTLVGTSIFDFMSVSWVGSHCASYRPVVWKFCTQKTSSPDWELVSIWKVPPNTRHHFLIFRVMNDTHNLLLSTEETEWPRVTLILLSPTVTWCFVCSYISPSQDSHRQIFYVLDHGLTLPVMGSHASLHSSLCHYSRAASSGPLCGPPCLPPLSSGSPPSPHFLWKSS